MLELGCGTGTTAIKLSATVGTYIASDYSPEMITIVDEKESEAMVANLEVAVGQICKGSLPEGPFDAILGFNLLHSLPDR